MLDFFLFPLTPAKLFNLITDCFTIYVMKIIFHFFYLFCYFHFFFFPSNSVSQCKHLYLVTCLKLDICYLQIGRIWMGDKEQVGIEKKNVLWGWSYVILGNENPQLVPEGRGYTAGSLVLPFSMSVSLCLHSLSEFPTFLPAFSGCFFAPSLIELSPKDHVSHLNRGR